MSIYLDNAATTFPKPDGVVAAISAFMGNCSASPGRSGHSMSLIAAREVYETRELLASFFNIHDSGRVIFTSNATHALNIAVKGMLKQGDHVITSHMEHNSVYRPLSYLQHKGVIELSVAASDQVGFIDLSNLNTLFRPNTRMVVINHGSNVFGNVQPIREIGKACRKMGVTFLVDAAQTAGFIPIDMQHDQIDLLVFSGHKKLYGPTGIGGLVVNTDVPIDTLIHGGTGSRSESEFHPSFYPDKLEAGTLNTVGIAGLKAGLIWLNHQGMDRLREQQMVLIRMLMENLKLIEGITLYGPDGTEDRLPMVSFNARNMDPAEVAHLLDKDHGIMTRAGLHCAPLAHKALGTFPQGAVRISLGAFNHGQEIVQLLDAIRKVCNRL